MNMFIDMDMDMDVKTWEQHWRGYGRWHRHQGKSQMTHSPLLPPAHASPVHLSQPLPHASPARAHLGANERLSESVVGQVLGKLVDVVLLFEGIPHAHELHALGVVELVRLSF